MLTALLGGMLMSSYLPVPPAKGELRFTASDPAIVRSFEWAKAQALHYVRDEDPVGPWYEAALPGRAAFCMRDVAHQAYGGQALGLADHTYNMLHKFAGSIAASRDWCGFWEIDRLDHPAPVDYTNDQDFWYTLPASFDVLDCCYRMFVWTGDRRYVEDPTFVEFYRRTMDDYIRVWDLSPERLMQRRVHVEKARGIPSYDETEGEFYAGVDLLFAEAAAWRSYGAILETRGERAGAHRCRSQAKALRDLLDKKWWDPKTDSFFGFLGTDGTMRRGDRWFSLYWDVLRDERKIRTLAARLASIPLEQDSRQVEDKSYYPEIDYRYGYTEEAYRQILDLSREGRYRREYPEVSFAILGAMARGLMGVEPKRVRNGWVVETLSGLPKAVRWAEMSGLPLLGTSLSVRHEPGSCTATNTGDKPIVWRACFTGRFPEIQVGNKPRRAKFETRIPDRSVSYVDVPLKPGQRLTARRGP